MQQVRREQTKKREDPVLYRSPGNFWHKSDLIDNTDHKFLVPLSLSYILSDDCWNHPRTRMSFLFAVSE